MATGSGFTPAADAPCYNPRMTRATAIAMRTAGTLRENCVVVITDGPTIGNGTTSPTEIELNPTSPTELGLTARVHTTFDNEAWAGTYDIDLGVAGSITELTDSLGNTAKDIDADSPTVHTQFPWGNAQWRDNYAEDTVFTSPQIAAPLVVTNNRFINTTMDFTGWASGSMIETLVQGGGTHHINGPTFASWIRSNIIGAVVDAQTAAISLTNSDIVDNATSVSTTGTGTISVNNSRVEDGSIVRNDGISPITVTSSRIEAQSQLLNDPASRKSLTLSNGSVMTLTTIRGQGGTINRSVAFSSTVIQGRPGLGDSINVLGDASISITSSSLTGISSTWIVDGPATASSLQWTNVIWDQGQLNHGPLATNCQFSNCELRGCLLSVQGPGSPTNFAVTINGSELIGTTIRHSAGVTNTLSISGTTAVGSGTIAMDNATPRPLLIDGGNVLSGSFSIIETGTTAPTSGIGSIADRVFNCTVQGGLIEFATTTGGTFGHAISECLVVDGPDAPGVPDGRIRIDGTSERIQIISCEVWGDLHITDAPEFALSGATAVYDNYIGSGSALNYVGGDNAIKQIRNNRIEGLSIMNLTGLTGSAGAGLADVFACRVANQSILNVNGARVVGFPVRNCIVENQAVLTVAPGGSALQFRVAQQGNVDTGAFTHFVTEVSGAFVKVLTASNTNRLCNKAFDDVI